MKSLLLSGQAQVWLYKLVGGRHDWPGAWGNMDVMISEEIWKFFQEIME